MAGRLQEEAPLLLVLAAALALGRLLVCFKESPQGPGVSLLEILRQRMRSPDALVAVAVVALTPLTLTIRVELAGLRLRGLLVSRSFIAGLPAPLAVATVETQS